MTILEEVTNLRDACVGEIEWFANRIAGMEAGAIRDMVQACMIYVGAVESTLTTIIDKHTTDPTL